MSKISLANKYRPKVFEDIVEQDSIKQVLLNQMKNNNLKHSYLFCGGAGTGKTTTARIIASKMNDNLGKPIEIDCATRNGVDDIRVIQEECRTKPLMGKYKIFILDEVHMLTVQAWNSMLKILEEPPEYVIFLFCTTDPQKIIATILSRVQRFNFQRISTEGIINRLKFIINCENNEHVEEPITYEDEAISYIARLAKGGMRDSITTMEKCLDYDRNLTLQNVLKVTSGGITEQTMLQLLQYMLNRDCRSCLEYFNEIYMSGIDVSLFIKLYIEFLENCIKYLVTQDSNITTISQITINWLQENSNFLETIRIFLLSAIKIRYNYSVEDLKIMIESWIIQECN